MENTLIHDAENDHPRPQSHLHGPSASPSGFRRFEPRGALARWLSRQYAEAVHLNLRNIEAAVDRRPGCRFLDLGCDDGERSLTWAFKADADEVLGVEILPERMALAFSRGLQVRAADLNHEIPFETESVDIMTSNQVFEHLWNSDRHLEEVARVLKVGGHLILSTENASSWCNVFAAALGWQIFSLTNFSNRASGLGNPLALHRGHTESAHSWTHQRIYSVRALREYAAVFGLKCVGVWGAGYFPLPARLGNTDSTHAHFITLKFEKMARRAM